MGVFRNIDNGLFDKGLGLSYTKLEKIFVYICLVMVIASAIVTVVLYYGDRGSIVFWKVLALTLVGVEWGSMITIQAQTRRIKQMMLEKKVV